MRRFYHVCTSVAPWTTLVDIRQTPPYNPNQRLSRFLPTQGSVMTTIRQLNEVQELDLDITRCGTSISSIANQIGDRTELQSMQEELDGLQNLLDSLKIEQRTQAVDAESLRDKVRDVDDKLYGGKITNPRELEASEKESTHLRNELQRLDDGLLRTMMSLEEAQEKYRSLEEALRQAEKNWKKSQSEMAKEQKGLQKTLATLEARRQSLVSGMERQQIKLYEDIRLTRGGQAIAKVERGRCRACSMALPTHQLQRARLGREPVLCSSCGRILFMS